MILRCDLIAQYKAYRDEIDSAILRVLTSGRYILGNEVSQFENEWARYVDSQWCVAVASGTDALLLAMKAFGIGPGDEVVTTPFAPIPTAAAISWLGARPVFVDIDRTTYLLDPNMVESAITNRTKAIIPVHLYGQMVNLETILTIAERRGIVVIEDAAQAHGSTYNGRFAGTIGQLGCFSFYPTKNLGAYGDGGAIVTDDGAVAEKCRLLRNYGKVSYDNSASSGTNSRLDELQAAILRAKLIHLNEMNEARSRLALIYQHELAELPVRLPSERSGTRANFHIYNITCPEVRDLLAEYLTVRGVQTNIYYREPLHLQKGFAYLGHRDGDFQEAEAACREVLALPMYPELDPKVVKNICVHIREFYTNN